MRILTILLYLLPLLAGAQATSFELSGRITGEHKDKIYLFYENQSAQRDSALIKDGAFRFHLKANLPILCRLLFDGNSNVQELYIDSKQTFVTLSGQITQKDIPDSVGGHWSQFEVTSVKGSRTEEIKRSYAAWQGQLEKSTLSAEQKRVEQFSKLQTLVTTYPKSKASAYLLAGRIYLFGQAFMFSGKFALSYSEVSQLAGLLDTSLHNTLEWQNLERLLERLDMERNRTTGKAFFDVVLKDTANRLVDTKTLRNKYTLVSFWASWCQPCRARHPKLKELYETYRSKGFAIVSVSLDTSKEAWKKAVGQDGLSWLQLIDEKAFQGALPRYYDIYKIPFKILLNEQGVIVGFDLTTEEIESVLRKEL